MQVWFREYDAAIFQYPGTIHSLFPTPLVPQDPELLSFIDIECYCWSTVLADLTPMINSGMVFCDRHYGGINYPKASAIPPPSCNRVNQNSATINCNELSRNRQYE